MKFIETVISNLSSENIAFISVLVTFLLYLLGKHSELKLKKHELKKDKYMEFISMLKDIYIKNGKVEINEKTRKWFFEFGSTILVYGSRKMYKKYCFFRESSCNYIKNCKFYNDKLPLFLIADLLNQIRIEVGLNDFELPLGYDSISFYTNDIYFNPYSSLNWWKSKVSVFLIKFELLLVKFVNLIPLKIVFIFLLLPIKMLWITLRVVALNFFGRVLKQLNVKVDIENNKIYREKK